MKTWRPPWIQIASIPRESSTASATVEAATELLAMRIGRPAFAKLLKQEPQIAAAILAALAGRVRRLEQGD